MTSTDSMTSQYGQLETLGVVLAMWAERDTRTQPEIRRTASTTIEAIDTLLGQLHELRSGVAGETRRSDDVAEVRLEMLLAPAVGGRSPSRPCGIAANLGRPPGDRRKGDDR